MTGQSPAAIREQLFAEWELRADGEPWAGATALVYPVRTRDGQQAALKVLGVLGEETEHEHLALQHWHGNGAVQLLRADPRRGALLLERLQPRSLAEEWDLEACEVVAGLYRRIHRPAPNNFPRLSGFLGRWAEQLAALPRSAPVPRRLVEQALSLARSFVADTGCDGTLIHTDLHFENVLAADRQPWLVIDPKPVSGDPHYEPAPMLWNRWDELAGDVRGGVRRRFHALVDAADFDEDRARDWVIVRMMINAGWTLTAPGPLTGLDQNWLTRCVTVAKAVQV